jgi:transposase
MPKSPPPYPEAFKAQIVALYRAGRTPKSLSQEFGPSDQAIRNWVRQANAESQPAPDELAPAEREELARLRKEVKNLRLEREILGKAAAWFAREAISIPSRDSSS